MAASPYTVGYGPRCHPQARSVHLRALPARMSAPPGRGQEMAAAVVFVLLQLVLIGLFTGLQLQ